MLFIFALVQGWVREGGGKGKKERGLEFFFKQCALFFSKKNSGGIDVPAGTVVVANSSCDSVNFKSVFQSKRAGFFSFLFFSFLFSFLLLCSLFFCFIFLYFVL